MKKLVETICYNCGKTYFIDKYSYDRAEKRNQHHYCSLSCAHAKMSHSHPHNGETKEKIRESINKFYDTDTFKERQQSLKDQHIVKTCPVCGKNFSVRKSESSRIYCSRKCYYDDENHLYRKSSCGGKRQGSGRGKKGWYKGYYCDSSWELAYVIYNIEHGIFFERNLQGFEYEYDGEKHLFYPDFKLEDGSYVEVKGAMTEQNLIKINSFKDKIQVIGKSEIKPYIQYVEEKYGKDFTKLYKRK